MSTGNLHNSSCCFRALRGIPWTLWLGLSGAGQRGRKKLKIVVDITGSVVRHYPQTVRD
jgi:hypothetical protein